jgi:hypothetical protein
MSSLMALPNYFEEISFGEINFFPQCELCLGKENPYLAHFVVPNVLEKESCWN